MTSLENFSIINILQVRSVDSDNAGIIGGYVYSSHDCNLGLNLRKGF